MMSPGQTRCSFQSLVLCLPCDQTVRHIVRSAGKQSEWRRQRLSAENGFSSKWKRNVDREGENLSSAFVRFVDLSLNAADSDENGPDRSECGLCYVML